MQHVFGGLEVVFWLEGQLCLGSPERARVTVVWLRVVGCFFHLLALQAVFGQQRAVFVIRPVQVLVQAWVPPALADNRSCRSLCCCGCALSPALQVSQEVAGFGLVPPPSCSVGGEDSPWRPPQTCPQGAVLPSGGMGLQVMLFFWQWHCRKFTAVKAADYLTRKIPQGYSGKCCHLSTAWSLPEARKYQWILKILFSDVFHCLGAMNVPCHINTTVKWLHFSLP